MGLCLCVCQVSPERPLWKTYGGRTRRRRRETYQTDAHGPCPAGAAGRAWSVVAVAVGGGDGAASAAGRRAAGHAQVAGECVWEQRGVEEGKGGCVKEGRGVEVGRCAACVRKGGVEVGTGAGRCDRRGATVSAAQAHGAHISTLRRRGGGGAWVESNRLGSRRAPTLPITPPPPPAHDAYIHPSPRCPPLSSAASVLGRQGPAAHLPCGNGHGRDDEAYDGGGGGAAGRRRRPGGRRGGPLVAHRAEAPVGRHLLQARLGAELVRVGSPDAAGMERRVVDRVGGEVAVEDSWRPRHIRG